MARVPAQKQEKVETKTNVIAIPKVQDKKEMKQENKIYRKM